jgi:hypothetical protein
MQRCGLTYRGEIVYFGRTQVYYAVERQAWPPAGVELSAVQVRKVD